MHQLLATGGGIDRGPCITMGPGCRSPPAAPGSWGALGLPFTGWLGRPPPAGSRGACSTRGNTASATCSSAVAQDRNHFGT
jgi:hypothetical protein